MGREVPSRSKRQQKHNELASATTQRKGIQASSNTMASNPPAGYAPNRTPANGTQDMMDTSAVSGIEGVRRSRRISDRVHKKQAAAGLLSAGADLGRPSASEVSGGSTKSHKTKAAKGNADGSAALDNTTSSIHQGERNTQDHSTVRGQDSQGQYTKPRQINMAPKNPKSMREEGDEVGSQSLASQAPFPKPKKVRQPSLGANDGVGELPVSSPARFSSNGGQVRKPVKDANYGDGSIDVAMLAALDGHVQQSAKQGGASTANSHALRRDNAQSTAPSIQLPSIQAPRPASPPPVLYDYQVDYLAKSFAAAKKLAETVAKLKEQKHPGFISPPSAPGPPVFGPAPPPGMATNQTSNAQAGPTRVPQHLATAPKKKETIEDIRRNMAKLLEDDPISDRAFAAMHYQGGGTASRQILREALGPLKDAFESLKPAMNNQHTKSQFLEQRAESSAHAQAKGDKLPSYAYPAPKADKKGKPVKKKSVNAEAAVAKAVKEFDKANRDYDDAFERNLRDMFD